MTTQLSFSKIENELLPEYRRKIGSAESTEDVKKFYVYTMRDLIRQVFAGRIDPGNDDIALVPDREPSFVISSGLNDKEDFSSIWNSSDLPNVVSRFTETAVKHYRHLEKNPKKTEAKIRM
ncbi:MAG: hypothetical protein C4531_09785 [Desulfurivibrio sp.]|jgi:hypothetical protein|nr:MAG: hypothetical protein C4531_09785 [Desulfurivibrio sp.]